MLFQGTVHVPWLSIAKCVPLYALAVAHFTCNIGYYTLLTCLPLYFKHILHFDIKSVSLSVCSVCFLNICKNNLRFCLLMLIIAVTWQVLFIWHCYMPYDHFLNGSVKCYWSRILVFTA